MFAFVVSSHVEYRIADGVAVVSGKCFRILIKWLVTLIFLRSEISDLWPPIHAHARG